MKNLLEKPEQLNGAIMPSGESVGRRIVMFVCMVLGLAVLLTTSIYGQGITGSITGTVVDPSGAPISDAVVTVHNVATNADHVVNTSDVGTFTITQLQPGQYNLKVDKKTFKSYVQKGITLQIDEVAQINATLQVGSATETVVVTTSAPVIQTEDSSIGLVVDSNNIQNTPLNGRLSVMGLIALAPGVQAVGAQDQAADRGLTPSIGTGSRNAYGGLGNTLDGVMNKEITLERAEPEVPSLDAIDQFKVIASGAPAEFIEPAQVIVVSKSGGNQLHGEGLEYNRSKGTGAKSFFAGSLARPPYQRNEFGGNLSGPVYIPKLYDGRDKTFFFVAYEGFHLTQASIYSTQQPTVKERNGDFSDFLAGGICATSTAGTTITDPNTSGPAFTGNVIPSSQFNAVDQQLLNILYPLPTTTGCGTNTVEAVTYTSNASHWSLRMDHKVNDKNQLRFTFMRAFYGPYPDSDTDSKQGGYSQDGEHNTTAILGWTHIFTPTLILDSYASFFHLPIYRTPQNVATNFSNIIPGLGTIQIEGAPSISITNITGVSESGSKDLEQAPQGYTTLTKVFAKHTVKTGFSFIWDDHWNEACSRGSYSFNGHYTGIAFADFLIGDPSSTSHSQPNCNPSRNLTYQYGAFVEDDWKLLKNLTINVGIRYDLQWFQADPYGKNSLYVPALKEIVAFGNENNAISNYLPGGTTPLPVVLSSAANITNNPFSYLGRPGKNFAPRFGFAYEPIPNTVVRGAVGVFYNLLPASYVASMYANLPFGATENYTQPSGTTPAFTMSNPFAATGSFTANPGVSAEHQLETPYTIEYNLAIEHQLAKGLDFRIGYVGQHNVRQNNASGSGTTTPNLNLLDPPIVGVSAQTTNLVQPFSSITLNVDPIFHSSMNSLQFGVHKQYGHGLAVSAEYQWTRVLGTENIEDPAGNTPNDSRGNIAGITPQVLQMNAVYALPFGHGQAFLGTVNNAVNKVISGWQVSAIASLQTGQPFSVSYSAPGTPTGLVSGRANRVPGVPLYPSKSVQGLSQWFNPAAFTAPPCYNSNGTGSCTTIYSASGPTTYATYGTSGYDMLWGPHWADYDINLKKDIPFATRYVVQLRVDSFNVFNHPNFSTPNASISNTSTVGTITSASGSPSYEPRTVEFAAKFNF